MRDVIIASNNSNKVKEISQILDGCDRNFLSLKDACIISDPVEDADTFEGNALIKARAIRSLRPDAAVLADDSGLEVDALNGRPGVFSARFAGDDASDDDNNRLLLSKLNAAAPDLKDRTARFVCCMAYIDEEGNEHTAQGVVSGLIGFEEAGDLGFGYDPLFYPDELGGNITFAQASEEQKNEISHRGRALEAIKTILLDK